MARHYCTPFLFQLLFLTILVLLPPSSAWKFGGGSKCKTSSSSTRSGISSNPSLQALDQELVELAELIRLQTEKLRVLEAYRRQVATGAVEVKGSDSATSQCAAPVFTPPSLSLSSSIEGASTSSALAEDYLVRLAALPATAGVNEGMAGAETGENGRVTALKMLTFQRVRDKAAPRGSHMQNSKAMNVLVVARTDIAGSLKDEKNKKRSDDSSTSTNSGRVPWLSFYDMQGQLLGQYTPPGHASAAITTLAFEAVGGEDALLVTGARDGSLSLHNVQLWKDGKIVAGRGPSASSVSSLSPPSFVVPPNVTSLDGFGIQVVHEASLLSSDARKKEAVTASVPLATTAAATAATNARSPALCALLYQHRGLGWMVFSGDVAGNIQCHFRNGTLFKAIYTGHPIHALTRNGKTLLYTADRDVHFLSAMTLVPYSTAYCRGRHGPLRSLAWDSLAPQVLHASTAHGDLLTFDTSPPHARRGQAHQQQQMYGGAAVEGNCALVKKLSSRTGGSAPLSLATVPGGYLLAVSARGDIFAYNTTGLRDTASPLPLVFHLNFPPPTSASSLEEDESSRILFSASLGRAMNVGAAAALTRMSPNFVVHMGKGASGNPSADKQASQRDDEGHLVLFEAILPYRRPKALEFSWIRLPLMCLALGLVFFWHFSKERRGKRPGLAGMERHPMPEPAQLRNIGLRPNGRRMYDLIEEDEDELEGRDGEPGGRAGAEDEDDDDQNRQVRGLLRARQARNFAF